MTSRRCDKTVSCHGCVLDVTLSRVTLSGDPSPWVRNPVSLRLGFRMHTAGRRRDDRVEHMSDPQGTRPMGTLDLDDQRLRYDACQHAMAERVLSAAQVHRHGLYKPPRTQPCLHTQPGDGKHKGSSIAAITHK